MHKNTVRKLSLEDWVLVLLCLSFTTLFSYLSLLRYQNFFTTNWDMGIAMQMLWTNTHGYLLRETADLMGYGTPSFLEIHSTYIALPLSLIYYLYPKALTIFVMQALAISLSVIPLNEISKKHVDDARVRLLIAVVYLLSFPMVSGLLYDFHWEAFIPLEFFIFFLYLSEKKFIYSAFMLVIGSLTLEVFPVLAVGVIIYFAMSEYDLNPLHVLQLLKKRDFRSYFYLLVLTVIIYFLVRVGQSIIVPLFVSNSPNVSTLGSTIASPVSSISVSFYSLGTSAIYWLLIFFSFLFIPMLKPKTLVMSLPWMFNSIILSSSFSSFFGNQYAIIAMPPIVIGFILSLAEIQKKNSGNLNVLLMFLTAIAVIMGAAFFLGNYSSYLLEPNLTLPAILLVSLLLFTLYMTFYLFRGRKPLGKALEKRYRNWGNMGWKKIILPFLLALLLLNLSMSPLNAHNFQATPNPGYQFALGVNPAYVPIPNLTANLPNNASIVASDNLFPYVANDPNAYSLYWFKANYTNIAYFPFNASNLPEFVFVDQYQLNLLPKFLNDTIFDKSIYGIIAEIHYKKGYPGNIFLMEYQYSGKTRIYYA